LGDAETTTKQKVLEVDVVVIDCLLLLLHVLLLSRLVVIVIVTAEWHHDNCDIVFVQQSPSISGGVYCGWQYRRVGRSRWFLGMSIPIRNPLGRPVLHFE
jgi:hypothetical protein